MEASQRSLLPDYTVAEFQRPADYTVAFEDWSPLLRRDVAEAVWLWTVRVLEHFNRGRWRYNHLANRWEPVSVLKCEPFVFERDGWRLSLKVPAIPDGPEGLRIACQRVMDVVARVQDGIGDGDYRHATKALLIAREAH